jgi:CubicO group peptidase (beta-lactamase class C family)
MMRWRWCVTLRGMTDAASSLRVNGIVGRGFERVALEFRANFLDRADVGAAFAATVDSHKAIDVWAGDSMRADHEPWTRNSLGMIFSGTKGLSAFCLLLLADRGLIDIDERVAAYWPDFASAGKDDIRVKHVLGHTAGVPGIEQPLAMSELLDGRRMAEVVAAQSPWWPPGEVLCYHALSFGWIAGELVRRVDGRTLGEFFDGEFAQPLGLDAWIGAPVGVLPRVARLVHSPAWSATGPYEETAASADARRIMVADNPRGRHGDPIPWNDPAFQAVEVPAINGIASARSMARLYRLLTEGGRVDGRRIFSPDAAAAASTPLAEGTDWLSGRPWRMGFGFQLHGLAPTLKPALRTVGHAGAGGSVHGAWPDLNVTFSYVMNELRPGDRDRATALLDALWDCL